jgi:hypothetical protein
MPKTGKLQRKINEIIEQHGGSVTFEVNRPHQRAILNIGTKTQLVVFASTPGRHSSERNCLARKRDG